MEAESIDNVFVSSDSTSKIYRAQLPESHGHWTQTAIYIMQTAPKINP